MQENARHRDDDLIKNLSNMLAVRPITHSALPVSIRWVGSGRRSRREKEIGNVSISEERREQRPSFVIMPCTGGIIDVASIPWKITEDDLCSRRPGNFG